MRVSVQCVYLLQKKGEKTISTSETIATKQHTFAFAHKQIHDVYTMYVHTTRDSVKVRQQLYPFNSQNRLLRYSLLFFNDEFSGFHIEYFIGLAMRVKNHFGKVKLNTSYCHSECT